MSINIFSFNSVLPDSVKNVITYDINIIKQQVSKDKSVIYNVLKTLITVCTSICVSPYNIVSVNLKIILLIHIYSSTHNFTMKKRTKTHNIVTLNSLYVFYFSRYYCIYIYYKNIPTLCDKDNMND